MSLWLRRSLAFWFIGAVSLVFVWHGRFAVREAAAQTGSPSVLTPEQLAEKLSTFVWKERNTPEDRFDPTPLETRLPISIISAQDQKLLEARGISFMLLAMERIWISPKFDMKRAEGGTENKVTVEVDPNEQLEVRPVVCIKENGNWKIDLIATYMSWAKIPESQKAKAVFDATGITLPSPVSDDAKRGYCLSQMQQISLALRQYTDDYDERLPKARDWQDALHPYVKTDTVFRCPKVESTKNVGYAYNSSASGKWLYAFGSRATSVLVYESTQPKINAYGVGELRANRHEFGGVIGSHFAFVDGHCKWYPATYKAVFKLNPVFVTPK